MSFGDNMTDVGSVNNSSTGGSTEIVHAIESMTEATLVSEAVPTSTDLVILFKEEGEVITTETSITPDESSTSTSKPTALITEPGTSTEVTRRRPVCHAEVRKLFLFFFFSFCEVIFNLNSFSYFKFQVS